jgi:hypothetical protein
MPEETTDAANLPSSSADSPHISSSDVPDDPSASASAEIFAAMDGSTIAEAEGNAEDAEGVGEEAAGGEPATSE